MSKEIIGRLVLEASTGLHGYVAKDLADHLASVLKQRADLLEALKYINRFIEPTSVDAESMKKHAAKAIAKAEQ